ncbi:MAG: transmembrane domain-containing protein [Gemmatimonadetes bacterium]|nr:transmembrane domain-containing protein [Gemmatimonadota bacterium]
MGHRDRRHIWIPCAVACAIVLSACTSDDEPVVPIDDPVPEDSIQQWSDPSAWPGGAVPAAGQAVVIPQGTTVELDVSPPALGGVTVEGELIVARRDIELTADWILVPGVLRVGTEAEPFTDRLRITLTGPMNVEAAAGMGSRLIGVPPGGLLEIWGEPRTAWTRLDATAPAGSGTIRVADDVDWEVGDRIAIAPSGFNPLEAEDREITAISGRTVTLDAALSHHHYGEIQNIVGRSVDQRAEVLLLNRSVTIRGLGVDDDGNVGPGAADGGGHVMILAGATARIQGVEFVHMGQTGQLGRYPVHWHMAGDVPGQFIRNSSIWRSGNRCVTVHGADRLEVTGNTCYDHLGHGYFLEDGAETGNLFVDNVGILGRRPEGAARLLPSDERPATFWVTNPNNHLEGNVAAGSQGIGFWYALPEEPTGPSAGQPDRPRRTPLGVFRDNVAHSNQRGGLFVDHGPRPDGETETTSYRPRQVPTDPNSEVVPAVFENLVAYKNAPRAVWLRGHAHRLTGAILADNAIGATFASSESFIEDAFVTAETSNDVSRRGLYRGFEFYDGRVGARRVTFHGFSGAGAIPWSALGYNRRNAFSVHTGNVAEDLEFIDSNVVYLEPPQADKDGDKAAVFLDALGMVAGTAGHWVVANTPLLTTPECDARPAWNASVCPGPYSRLILRASSDFAPIDVVRDDAAEERFVGIGNNPDRASMSLVANRAYAIQTAASAGDMQLNLRDGRPGEWIEVQIDLGAAPSRIVRDYWEGNPMNAAGSLAEVRAGDGSVYWYDAANGRLHLKLVVQPDRDWAHLRLVP